MSEAPGEKNLPPTEKRLREAIAKGDVLRSPELGAAVATLIGGAWFQFGGPWLLDGLVRVMRAGFVWNRASIDGFSPGHLMLAMLLQVLLPLALLGVMVIAGALAAQFMLGRGRFVPAKLKPKGSKFNPLSWAKRSFGPQGWIEAGKGILKVVLLGAIVWVWIGDRMEEILALGKSDLKTQFGYAWEALTSLLFMLTGGLVLIALIDVPVQYFRRRKRLFMSLQEMKDEQKESEGSPEKRAAVRSRQRQIAMGSVNQAMREAQFVVANPIHFAVAMTYDPALAPAPVVLAKGRGEKALAMRELAAEYDVPVLEIPVLARSVYYTTRERQMIREELYGALAAVLAFVLSLKRGDPAELSPIEVPAELRFDADGRPDPEAN